MDERDLRIATLELLIVERLALDPPGVHQQLVDSIYGVGLDGYSEDERAVRTAALDEIAAAKGRFDEFAGGVRIAKGEG
jgi:hypothetical protein